MCVIRDELVPFLAANASNLILNIQPDGGAKLGRSVENVLARVTLPRAVQNQGARAP